MGRFTRRRRREKRKENREERKVVRNMPSRVKKSYKDGYVSSHMHMLSDKQKAKYNKASDSDNHKKIARVFKKLKK